MPKALVFLLLTISGPASAAISPEAELRLNEGVAQLFSLDYEASRKSFRKIIELEPEHPAGYLFESGGIWWQSSQEYGLFKDTPTLQGLFERDVSMALKKAEVMLKSPRPEDKADAHFVLGMAYGTRGQWGLMRGHLLRACFDGRKAAKHLKKCVELDPDFADAYLGLGVYDYQAARLPGLIKMSAGLCGAHGDQQKGLAQMRLAMEKGRYGPRQAAVFLLSIYIADLKDYARALAMAQKLRADFPGSPYFIFLESVLRLNLGDRDGSLKEGRELFGHIYADPVAFGRKWISLLCGFSGSKCLDKYDFAKARDWFQYAIESESFTRPEALSEGDSEAPADLGEMPEDSPAWLSFNHLFKGYSADALGRREEATQDYQWVLDHPDFADSHARANVCLKSPCGRTQLLAYFRSLTRQPQSPEPDPAEAAPSAQTGP